LSGVHRVRSGHHRNIQEWSSLHSDIFWSLQTPPPPRKVPPPRKMGVASLSSSTKYSFVDKIRRPKIAGSYFGQTVSTKYWSANSSTNYLGSFFNVRQSPTPTVSWATEGSSDSATGRGSLPCLDDGSCLLNDGACAPTMALCLPRWWIQSCWISGSSASPASFMAHGFTMRSSGGGWIDDDQSSVRPFRCRQSPCRPLLHACYPGN
jgi:hypothetical protein